MLSLSLSVKVWLQSTISVKMYCICSKVFFCSKQINYAVRYYRTGILSVTILRSCTFGVLNWILFLCCCLNLLSHFKLRFQFNVNCMHFNMHSQFTFVSNHFVMLNKSRKSTTQSIKKRKFCFFFTFHFILRVLFDKFYEFQNTELIVCCN